MNLIKTLGIFLSSLLFLFFRCPSWCDRIFLSHSYRELIEEVSARILQKMASLFKAFPYNNIAIYMYYSDYPGMSVVLINCEIIYRVEVAIQ